MDISAASLKKAIQLAQKHHVEARLQPRLSNGLVDWEDEVPDTVIIAGLSGHTIAEIIQAGEGVLRKTKSLLLQPMQAVPALRQWLAEHQWYVQKEALILEEGRYFFSFQVCPTTVHPLLQDSYDLSTYLHTAKDPTYYQWLQHRKEGDLRQRERLVRRSRPGDEQAIAVIDARREREGQHIASMEQTPGNILQDSK